VPLIATAHLHVQFKHFTVLDGAGAASAPPGDEHFAIPRGFRKVAVERMMGSLLKPEG
jgi:hypothetical protein